MIAIVGRQISITQDRNGKLFGALGVNKINIRIIEQCVDEITMIAYLTKILKKRFVCLYESFAK